MRAVFRSAGSAFLTLVFLVPAAADPRQPSLSLPIACAVGEDCFIQNYADTASGASPRDYACGAATYEGHKGVDIRVLSAAAARAGVAVLAAADGRITAARDEMADHFPERTGDDVALLKGRECGNGVMLDHGNGWTTQYCHMRRGSVTVKPGQKVRRGERMGEVGYSGLAEFAHVHVTVRHNGQAIDPFTGRVLEADMSCLKDPATARGVWDEAARAKLGYRGAEIIGSGIAGGTASQAQLEMDHRAMPAASRDSEQLIMIARIIKIAAGESVRITLRGPGALSIDTTSKPLDKAKATYLAWGGSKRPAGVERWPAGRYEGSVTVLDAKGGVTTERKIALDLN